MEYMESKMQDVIEAGIAEMDYLLETHNPPVDWGDPKWSEYDKVHGWRNYVSDELQTEWPNFTGRQKILLSSCFQEVADREEWD